MAEKNDNRTFPCSACGGKMKFDPDKQALVCESCGSVEALSLDSEAPTEYAYDSRPTEEREDWGAEVRVIACSSCGARSVMEGNTTSQACPFCGAPYVAEDMKERAGIAPESLIPFTVSEKKANEAFKTWLKKRYMAPRALQSSARKDGMRGVYLPHWTYDAETTSRYIGRAGDHYYVTEQYQTEENGKTVTKTREVQKTRWRPTGGRVEMSFDDVLVNASSQNATTLLDRVRPFDLTKLVKFAPSFLSGFLAEKAGVTVEEGWDKAKESIDSDIRDACRDDILRSADEAEVISVSSKYSDVRYKLLMLPLWLSSYRYKGKLYSFVVNGQTGKVKGEAPVSGIKVALIVAAVLAVIALLILAFSNGNA